MISTDFVCTYKFITDDEDTSDELWRQQFLQVVGCYKGYDDNTINSSMEEAYDLITKSKHGRQFFDSVWKEGLAHPLNAFITRDMRDKSMELICLQAYFGWPTLDLIHKALIKLKQGTEVEWEEWQTIINSYKKYK